MKDPPSRRLKGRGVQLQNHLRHLPGPQGLCRRNSGREDREAEPLYHRALQRGRFVRSAVSDRERPVSMWRPRRIRVLCRLPSSFKYPGDEVHGDPNLPREICCVQVQVVPEQSFEGPKFFLPADLPEFIKVQEPDVILHPYADTWLRLIVKKARRYGLEPTISRSGWLMRMASSRSSFLY